MLRMFRIRARAAATTIGSADFHRTAEHHCRASSGSFESENKPVDVNVSLEQEWNVIDREVAILRRERPASVMTMMEEVIEMLRWILSDFFCRFQRFGERGSCFFAFCRACNCLRQVEDEYK